MKNNTIFLKVIQFLLFVSFIIWLGGYISRHMVIYQLFEPEGLVLRPNYNLENLNVVWNTISPLLVSNLVSFPLFILFYLSYLFFSKINLKKEGWLFISTIVILITAPFEIYLLIKDYEIVRLIYSSVSNSEKILNLIRERINILSSFSLIEIFSYLAIVFLTILKPLSKTDEIKREGT
ncbi:MAG: hypothetical protein WCZ90_11715 [Melioribacteraceae bacterium]